MAPQLIALRACNAGAMGGGHQRQPDDHIQPSDDEVHEDMYAVGLSTDPTSLDYPAWIEWLKKNHPDDVPPDQRN